MPVQFQFPSVDLSGPLTQLGSDIAGGISQRSLERDMQGALNPDGTMNFEKATAILMRHDPKAALALASQRATADAMNGYRTGMLGVAQDKAQTLDEKIFDWYKNGGQGPMMLGPDGRVDAAVNAADAEASGGPVASTPTGSRDPANMPSVVANKILSPAEIARQKALGSNKGNLDAFNAALKEQSPQMQQMLDNLVHTASSADEGTFENALGPWQGADTSSDWRGTLTSGLPQTLGAMSNYLEKGYNEGFTKGSGANLELKQPGDLSGGFTTTLRDNINSTAASLTGMLQRLMRVKGIGAQSDAELRQLIIQVGDLNKSRNKQDFHDRLANVVQNFKAAGFNLDVPTMSQVTGGPKIADRLPPEGDAPAQANMGGPTPVKTFSIDPATGAETPTQAADVGGQPVPGATRNPNGAYTGPSPAGTVMSNGTQTIIKGADGRWYDKATKKPLPGQPRQ